MLGAGSQIHIPVARLGEPAGAQHLAAAGGTDIFFTGHGTQRHPLVRVIIEHLPGNAAGDLRTVETVFVALQGRIVFIHTPLQVQHGTDQGGMIGIAQCVVGRTGRLDAENLHSGFQGLLGVGAIGLGIEDHLGIVPLFGEALIQSKQAQVFPKNADIIKAPGHKYDIIAAPAAELLHSLREGHALFLQTGFLDAGELADPAVQMPVIFRSDHDLEFVRNELFLSHPNRADLNDLAPDGNGKLLPGGGRAGPGLIPFHIQYDIIHCENL